MYWYDIWIDWRIVTGTVQQALAFLFGRAWGRRDDLVHLTGLRNGHKALAVGPSNSADLEAMERMLSPDGHLVHITSEGLGPAVERSESAGRGASRLVCKPSEAPFRPETFDAIIVGDPGRIDVLVPLLKPAGVLSLVQAGGRGFGRAAHRRSQLSDAGLEVIDSPGMGFSYVVNARRPIESGPAE